jgi:hypothetical protein
MRDDLLDAQACVDWAIAQFPSFQKRIDSWLADNVNFTVKDSPAPAAYDPVIAFVKSALPREFNVEVGTYINTIRSSLDILASTLATRSGAVRHEDAYFPIARSATAFMAGDYRGHKLVKALPQIERSHIETLKPYQGGDETLWALHQFDIVRKHRRLIDAEVVPLALTLDGRGTVVDFKPGNPVTGWLRTDEETVIGFLGKGSSHPDIKFMSHVAITEAGPFFRKPVVATLAQFAGAANAIIKLFDAS